MFCLYCSFGEASSHERKSAGSWIAWKHYSILNCHVTLDKLESLPEPSSYLTLIYPCYVHVLSPIRDSYLICEVQNENMGPFVQKTEKNFFLSSIVSLFLSTYDGVFDLLFNITLPWSWGYLQDNCKSSKAHRAPLLWLSMQVYVSDLDPSCICTKTPTVEVEEWVVESTPKEVGRSRRWDHTWATTPSPQGMLHCPIGLYLQNTNSEI